MSLTVHGPRCGTPNRSPRRTITHEPTANTVPSRWAGVGRHCVICQHERMAWKIFSLVAGVSSFSAISISISNADTGAWGVLVGNVGAFFIAMTVYHYIASLPRDRRPTEPPRTRATTAARETRA